MEDNNNIVDYLEQNMDMNNLMENINDMPQTQPTFEQPAPQYDPKIDIPPPNPNDPTQEQIMMMQTVTDARQIQGATIMSTQPGPGIQVQSTVLFNGKFYPMTLFQPKVLEQLHAVQQQMRIQQQQQLQQQLQQQIPLPCSVQHPPPTPKKVPNNDNPVIDLAKDNISDVATSEKENKVSMSAPLMLDYKKSILVLILVLAIMNSGLDEYIIGKVAFLNNKMVMLVCKALILTVIYHLVASFIPK